MTLAAGIRRPRAWLANPRRATRCTRGTARFTGILSAGEFALCTITVISDRNTPLVLPLFPRGRRRTRALYRQCCLRTRFTCMTERYFVLPEKFVGVKKREPWCVNTFSLKFQKKKNLMKRKLAYKKAKINLKNRSTVNWYREG